jgi:hypothetical protein
MKTKAQEGLQCQLMLQCLAMKLYTIYKSYKIIIVNFWKKETKFLYKHRLYTCSPYVTLVLSFYDSEGVNYVLGGSKTLESEDLV